MNQGVELPVEWRVARVVWPSGFEETVAVSPDRKTYRPLVRAASRSRAATYGPRAPICSVMKEVAEDES